MAGKPTYKDFDLSFGAHPMSGDVSSRTDAKAVTQAIRVLVMGSPEEFLFEPEVGGGIYGLLFQQATPLLEVDIKNRIEDTIRAHEPRCDLKSVNVTRSPDGHGFNVTLVYYILNNPDPVQVVLPLRRLG